MDPCSTWIYRDGVHVGFLQWHGDRDPRIVLSEKSTVISIPEVKQCLEELERRKDA